MQGEDSSTVLEFFGKKNLASFFGSKDFIEWVKAEYFDRKKHGEIPQSRQLAPTIQEIKEAVKQSFGITEMALELTKRGQINEPRNLAIFLSRKISGLKLEDICKEFGLGRYSSVSSVVIRTGQRLSQSKL
jgi:chromosomal replication initiation ATPase DnaA